METSQPASAPKKEKKGLKKLWAKVKTAIKSKPTTPTSQPTTTVAATTPAAPATTPAQPGTDQPAPERSVAVVEGGDNADVPSPSKPDPISHKEPPETAKEPPPATTSLRKDEAVERFERAQAIFKKYNIELEESDWTLSPKGQVERVYKVPRMRVRWICHECGATFGHEKVCKGCAHERCKTCTRYPPRKKGKKTNKHKAPVQPTTTDINTGVCHQCRTGFTIGSAACPNCRHEICEQCLKETVATPPPTTSTPTEFVATAS